METLVYKTQESSTPTTRSVCEDISEHHCLYILMNPYGEMFLSLAPWISGSTPDRTVKLELEDDGKILSFQSGVEVHYVDDWFEKDDGQRSKIRTILFNKRDSTITVQDDEKISFLINDDNSLSLFQPYKAPDGTKYGIGIHTTITHNYDSYDEQSMTSSTVNKVTDKREMFQGLKLNLMSPQFYPKDCEPKRMEIKFGEPKINRVNGQIEYDARSVPANAVVQDSTYYLMFKWGIDETRFIIRGKVNGDKVSFPARQFATLDYKIDKPEYLVNYYSQEYYYDIFCYTVAPEIAYDAITGRDELRDSEIDEEMVFDYDPATLCLSGGDRTWRFTQQSRAVWRWSSRDMSHPEVLEARENSIVYVNADTDLSVVNGQAVLSRPGDITVYSTDGRKVASGHGTSLDLTTLGHGIFIIRTADKALKVRI